MRYTLHPTWIWTSYDNQGSNFIHFIPVFPEQYWQFQHLWPVHAWLSISCALEPSVPPQNVQPHLISSCAKRSLELKLHTRDNVTFRKQNHVLNRMFLPCLSVHYCQLQRSKFPASTHVLGFLPNLFYQNVACNKLFLGCIIKEDGVRLQTELPVDWQCNENRIWSIQSNCESDNNLKKTNIKQTYKTEWWG